MRTGVVCVRRSTPVRELYTLLRANKITGAPVLDSEGGLAGVVSLSDIARCVTRVSGCSAASSYWGDVSLPMPELEELGPHRLTEEIMSVRIHSVDVEATVDEVLRLMLEHDIHRVIVTRDGEVTGILTSGDMMRLFLRTLEESGQA